MNKRLFAGFTILSLLLAGCAARHIDPNNSGTPDGGSGGEGGGGEVDPVVPTIDPDDIWVDPSGEDDSGTYDIKIWVDDTLVGLTTAQVDSFVAYNKGKYKINLTIENHSEVDAAAYMLQEVATGADLYMFPSDYLLQLKIAGALTTMSDSLQEYIVDHNDESSVESAMIDGRLYGFPVKHSGPVFLYYDKRVLSSDDVNDMSTLLEKCKESNMRINYEAKSNGFYGAAYFMATGCYSNWTVNQYTGEFVGYDDTYYSNEGLIAAKGLQVLDDRYVRNVSGLRELGNTVAAAVSGPWDYAEAYALLGDNLGCAELPSFTVDGQSYHLSGFDTNTLLGIKPQVDTKKLSVCRKLAQYLTNSVSQMERFNLAYYEPTNVNALTDSNVTSHPAIIAMRNQREYCEVLKPTPGAWFDHLSAATSSIRSYNTESELNDILRTYYENLTTIFDEL